MITTNFDLLHTRAGTKNVQEMYGSIFRTQCSLCEDVQENIKQPICEALKDRGFVPICSTLALAAFQNDRRLPICGCTDHRMKIRQERGYLAKTYHAVEDVVVC